MDKLPEDPAPDDGMPEEPADPTPAADAVPPPYVPPPDPQQPAPDTFPPPAEPGAKDDRPGVGPGVATGCGLQVLAVIVFFLTSGYVGGILGILWPFILITVAAALLMISKRWRRFATGALIVSAAMWIVVIGPCIALLSPGLWGG